MPAQDLLSLGYGNVIEFKQETNDLVKSLLALKAAAKDVEGTIGNFGNFGAGIKDFKQASDQLTQSQTKLADATDQYNKAALQQAKITKANADAQKAQIAADNEVIKQISLEADAEKKLAVSKQATAKASKQKADAQASENIPFTSNLNPDGSINEPAVGATSGSVVSDAEQQYAGATNEAVAFSEAQKQVAAETKTADQIIVESTGFLDEYVGSLQANIAAQIENEAALAANKAAQKELLTSIAASEGATEAQTAKLVQLRQTQLELVETNKQLSVTTKNQVKDFISVEGSTDALRARLTALIAEYDKLSIAEKQSQFGVSIKQQIDTLSPAVTKAEQELGKSQRLVGNYENSIVNAFKKVTGGIRQAANILPGLGQQTIYLLAFTAIAAGTEALAKNFDLLAPKVHVVDEVIQGTDESSQHLRDSLKELGDNAEDIAEGAFKKLGEATQKLQDDLGETPDAVEVAQGALVLLQNDLDKLTKKYQELSDLSNLSTAGSGGLGNVSLNEQLSTTQSAIDKKNKLIAEGNSKIAEQNIAQQREDLLGQQAANQKFLEDNIQLKIDANNKIISNDKKAFEQRRDALSENYDKTLQLNKIELDKDLQASKNNEGKKNLALEKYRYDNLKAQQDYQQKLYDLNQKAAELSFNDQKDILQAEIDKANKIRDNDKLLYTFRDDAAQQSFDLVNKLINLELANRKITSTQATIAIAKNETELNDKLQTIFQARYKLEHQDENIPTPKQYYDQQLKQLEDAHNRGLISEAHYREKFNEISSGLFALLPADQQIAQQLAKQKEVNDEIIKNVQAAGEDRVNIIAKSQAEANTKLNDEYAKGLISAEQYEKGKRDLAIKYAKESLEALIHIKESELLLDKQGNASTNTIDKLTADIAKLKEQLSELGVSTTENLGSDLIGNLEKIAEATQNVSQAFTDLSEISLNNQIAQLEEIGAKEEKNYEQEQQNIQNSTLSQEDKANALKVLDAEHNAQQEKIQRQEKQYNNQKAKFDRDASILNIITGTLAAAAKAGWVTPVAIAIEIAGAAGLIKALATKIPSYFKGKDKTPKSEWALTDELGPELYIEPSGNMFLGNDKPTLRYLQAGTQVIPSDEVNQILHYAMLKKAGQSVGNIKEAAPDKFDYDKMRRAFADVMRMQKRPTINRRDLSAIGGELALKNAMQEWKNLGKRN